MSAGCSVDGGFQLVRERAPAAAFVLTPDQTQAIEACRVAAGMIEAAKGFRKLKAHRQLPFLRAALIAQQERLTKSTVAPASRAA